MSETRDNRPTAPKPSVTDSVRTALAAARAGDTAGAERLCRAALAADGHCFEALALLGTLVHEQGRDQEADGLLALACAIRPDAADVFGARGLVLRALGRHEEALAVLDEALALRADFFEAHFNRGNTLLTLKRYADALAAFDHALTLRPGDAGAWTHRGIALQELSRPEEALASHERATELAPEHVSARVNHGNTLRALGRTDEALDSYRRALAIRPDDADALINMAAATAERDEHAAVIDLCDRALVLAPDHVDALRLKARALQALNRHDEALSLYEAAFAARRDVAGALGVGNALQALGRYDEALSAAETALELRPGLAAALNNRGNAQRALGRHRDALESYSQAIMQRPDDVDAHWNEGLTRLALGDFDGGWPKYEWRLRGLSYAPHRQYPGIPVWQGDDELAGKTILLHAEQGFGDTIQFARYARLVAERGARVLLACGAPLAALLRTVDGVDEVVAAGEPAPEADCQALLMSLPMAFETRLESIPAEVPYVAADTERIESWRARLAVNGAPRRIGVCWRGNPEHPWASTRDCPANLLAPLLRTPDCAFYSLQLDEGASEIAELLASGLPLVDLATELGDFHETAALLSALDLVISVDTAAAHLAGALGRPTWLLLQFAADWRWMVDRDDSPWYPSLRLFRQAAPGDWQGVVQRVAEELAALGE